MLKLNLPSALLAVFVLSQGSVAVAADTKVGFIDSQKIQKEAPQYTKAQARLKKEFEKRDMDLQRMAKQLQTMQENLEKNAVTLSESERRNKGREFGEMSRDFQRKRREFGEDLTQRQNEEFAAINERITKVIKQIGEAEKYDVILQDGVYFSPRVDITDKVIKALGDGSK